MKKNHLLPILVTIGVLALAITSLVPTMKWYSMSKDEQSQLRDTNKKEASDIESKSIKLGLDLQGGMHLVLEVDMSEMDEKEKEGAVDRAIRVIRNRIDQFGVSEPHIQKQGSNRIIVELPGVDDLERAKELIGQTAVLEFKLVAKDEEIASTLKRIDDYIKRTELKQVEKDTTVDSAKIDTKVQEADNKAVQDVFGLKANSTDSIDSTKVTAEAKQKYRSLDAPFSSLFSSFGREIIVTEEYYDLVDSLINDEKIKKVIRKSYSFAFGPERTDAATALKYKTIFLVRSRAELEGEYIRDAQATYANGDFRANEAIVSLTMNSEGAIKFSRVTGRNKDRRLAIVLDNNVIMAPTIQSKIRDGRAQITGLGTIEKAKDIAIVLEAGALPAPVKIVEERSVGATLGGDSISKAWGTIIGSMLILSLFIFIYYTSAGVIAIASLSFLILIIMGILAKFGFTLTLPGIAGLVLTLGMAIDSNILVFERIRDDLKVGKTLRSAIESGFGKAKITILDANITTLFTGVILFYYGTGPIKGFALTLMIGIVGTLFVALFVTKLSFSVIMDKMPKLISVGKLAVFKGTSFSFMAIKKKTALVSILLVIISIGSIAVKGFNYGIDFNGGSLIQVRFEESLTEKDLRSVLTTVNGASASEIKSVVGGDIKGSEFLITIGVDSTGDAIVKDVNKALIEKYPTANVLRQEMVGPKIGTELKSGAVKSIMIAILGIILYIWIRFRFWYGISAIIALVHDVVITLGIFSITQTEMSLNVVAALLTIVGYSLNDTIVIFDRIRENIKNLRRVALSDIMNKSINETLSRTSITSLTTFFTVASLFLFGPETIRTFSGAMIIGVVVGTYSSIFIASPSLDYFISRTKKNSKVAKIEQIESKEN